LVAVAGGDAFVVAGGDAFVVKNAVVGRGEVEVAV